MATIIQATFTGEDKSLGYRKYCRYTLEIDAPAMIAADIIIRPITNDLVCYPCPYSTIGSFLKNWTDIKVIKLIK
jgi:hypothetical protein